MKKTVYIILLLILFFFIIIVINCPNQKFNNKYALINYLLIRKCQIGYYIPNFRVNEKSLYYYISKQKYTYIIIDNCNCKDYLLNECLNNNKDNYPIFYIYTSDSRYAEDNNQTKYNFYHKCLTNKDDLLSNIPALDIVNFPALFLVNKNGKIISIRY